MRINFFYWLETFFWFFLTKVRFRRARIVRGGFRLRLDGRVKFGAGFTTGFNNRVDVFRDGHLVLGRNFRMTDNNHIGCALSVTIGDDVLVASGVYISDHDHAVSPDFSVPIESGLVSSPVVIGDRVWIGEKASILKGVELGDDCVVAAHCVVTKSFPARSVIGGVPGRILRMR